GGKSTRKRARGERLRNRSVVGKPEAARVVLRDQVEALHLLVHELLDEPADARRTSLEVLNLAHAVDHRAQPGQGLLLLEQQARGVYDDEEVDLAGAFGPAAAPALKPLKAEVVVDAAIHEREQRWRITQPHAVRLHVHGREQDRDRS